MEKVCRKYASNTSTRHLYNFGKLPKTANPWKKNSFENKIF